MVRDLSAELRRKRREQKEQPCRHVWRQTRGRYERCEECGDHFPCKSACVHFDCAERRLDLAMDFDFPEAMYECLTMEVYDEETGRCLFDNTEELE